MSNWTVSKSISIHALLAESDYDTLAVVDNLQKFLSTLSLRRATSDRSAVHTGRAISIHALLAESDLGIAPLCQAVIISIHALLAESDPVTYHTVNVLDPISIHALLAESDGDAWYIMRKCAISIHALLAESDCWAVMMI